MASSTDRRAAGGSLALLAAALLLQGCATGALFEAGRRTETVVSFEEAYTDGERLWLVYESETSNRSGEAIAHGSRTAVVALSELDPARGHPLDALPVERARELGAAADALRRVGFRPATPSPASLDPGPLLLVQETDGRATGLSLVGFDGVPPGAQLYSGSLLTRGTAPWVYPILPVAAAYDTVALPATIFFAIPFFVVGE